MNDIIRLLPDSIANQIAAGEVVQRPSSVVKELIENALDAGATHIQLILRDAGKMLVQVIDNGQGMTATDARMSFERHATSKLKQAEDLFALQTMGFRGEALASIAAVAQVEMRTHRKNDEMGTTLQVEASQVKNQQLDMWPVGTSVAVKNLFYNIPARKNFLKSVPVELKHCTEEFVRIALSRPDVRMAMSHNDQEMYALDEGKLSRRIVQLFGKNYQQQLIQCTEEMPSIRVTGYVGKPEFSKKTRGEQFFFVNGRFIRNAYLHHAILTAYEGLLVQETHPFYVLNIEIDPGQIDVNVHPTKTEIKFTDDRLVYGLLQSAVRKSLAAHHVMPPLDFSTDVNFDAYFSQSRKPAHETHEERAYGSFKTVEWARGNSGKEKWETLFQQAEQEERESIDQANKEVSFAPLTGMRRLESDSFPSRTFPKESGSHVLNIHHRFLVRQVKSGMVLLDQVAAFERILYERFQHRLQSQEGVCQSVLFPQQIELQPGDLTLIEEMKAELQKIGFDVVPFGGHSLVINGVPPEVTSLSEKDALEELLEQYKVNKDRLGLSVRDNLARSLARRVAKRTVNQMHADEQNQLIDQLFACQQPNYTPDGQPTYVVLSLDKLASLL